MASATGGNGEPDAIPDGTRIGAQLRAARLAARMSMAEVAEQAGLTKGFVSKLERDLANVSVASLIRLCDALGVSVGSLFQAPKGEVVRRDARPRINFGGRKMTEYLLTPSGEKRAQAILSDIEPGGGSGNEPYSLPADVELVFVLAGQLEVTVAGEQITLEQGDAFTFPANVEHTFGAPPQAGPTQVLWVVSPALPDHGLEYPRAESPATRPGYRPSARLPAEREIRTALARHKPPCATNPRCAATPKCAVIPECVLCYPNGPYDPGPQKDRGGNGLGGGSGTL